MAADGTVLAVAETMAVKQGRELTQKTLQASLDAQVEEVEKKFARTNVLVRNEEGSSRPQAATANDIRWRRSPVANLSAMRSLW